MRFSRSINLYVSSLLLLTSAACKHNPGNSSEVKHEFAKTSRPQEAMKDCHAAAAGKLEDMSQLALGQYFPLPNKQFKKADAYITKIVDQLISSNPDTFKGVLARKNFCVNVVHDPGLNAFAMPGYGNIIVFDSYILSANSDADIAATLAHELAHVTMFHNDDAVHPLLLKDAGYVAMKKVEKEFEENDSHAIQLQESRDGIQAYLSKPQFSILLDEFEQYLDLLELSVKENRTETKLSDKVLQYREAILTAVQGLFKKNGFEKVGEELKSLLAENVKILDVYERARLAAGIDLEPEERRILGADYKSVMANWQEQEADEVGYELYLRAGFNANTYGQGFVDALGDKERVSNTERLLCLAQVAKAQKTRILDIQRGADTHPSSCFRLFDMNVVEKSEHAKDYAALLPKATRKNFVEGELEAVKATFPAQ